MSPDGTWAPVTVPVAGLGHRPSIHIHAARVSADSSSTPARGLLRTDSLPEGQWAEAVVHLSADPAFEVCGAAAYRFRDDTVTHFL